MNLVPRRVARQPMECRVVVSYRDMDRLCPDGTIEEGATHEVRQVPGHGWLWLGRIWFWRDW